MYIYGLDLPISSAQVLEALVVYSTFDFFRHLQGRIYATGVHAESKGGNVRADNMPILGRIVSPIHMLAALIPPVIYISVVVLNKLRQPEWMASFALPDKIVGTPLSPEWKGALKIGACATVLSLKSLIDSVIRHLGDQWHYLGRRERPRVVQTSPYAWVRHPLYTTILLQEALSSVMFWSYIPLIALGITTAVFVVKIPVEEDIIQRDEGIKEEYGEYTKRVPARLVPYVW